MCQSAQEMSESDQKLKAWFSHCIEENMGSLYATALRLTKNKPDAEDLVADAVSKAWSSIDSLADRKKFRSWIFCIQRNCFFSQYRKKSIRPEELVYDEHPADSSEQEIASLLIQQPDEFLNWWANPEKQFINNMLREDIISAVNRLPEVFQEVVMLINLEGFSYDEAAKIQGVSPGTIRSRMNRGRTLLQKALWQHAKDAGMINTQAILEPNT